MGEWVNINPAEIESKMFSSTLDIDENGEARFQGGMGDSEGEFSWLDSAIYIDARSFQVLQEPRELYWLTINPCPLSAQVQYASHAMRLEEYKKQSNFPDNVQHDLVKNDWEEETDPRSFFSDYPNELQGSENGTTAWAKFQPDSLVWLRGWHTNGQDTTRFWIDDSYVDFRDGATIHLASYFNALRFEPDGNGGLLMGRSTTSKFEIFDERQGYLREFLLQ